ncbi:hypothetical protein LCGC14_1547780 [marine sediment metagenome]|uniref:Uncharacterized protein n=1 Tax=marine sediment metagenome TaxID=412755 RepID=A0A0F9L761_9ZZZZ
MFDINNIDDLPSPPRDSDITWGNRTKTEEIGERKK